jgi:hypothetical protein
MQKVCSLANIDRAVYVGQGFAVHNSSLLPVKAYHTSALRSGPLMTKEEEGREV